MKTVAGLPERAAAPFEHHVGGEDWGRPGRGPGKAWERTGEGLGEDWGRTGRGLGKARRGVCCMGCMDCMSDTGGVGGMGWVGQDEASAHVPHVAAPVQIMAPVFPHSQP
eukprot:365139-Chlamydomonas_euryale.AAC.23